MNKTWMNRIPSKLLKDLEQQGMKDNLLFGIRYDMTEDGQYGEGYLFLLKDKLLKIESSKKDRTIHSFGGYGEENRKSLSSYADYDSQTKMEYSLESIDRLEMQTLVSGGLLMSCQDDGEDRFIAMYTNTCSNGIKKFIRLFELWKDKGELSEEDYKERAKEEKCPTCGSRYPNQDRKVCPKCMDRSSIFHRTLRYFAPYKKQIIIMMICYFGSAGLNLIWPYLNGKVLYDQILAKDESFLQWLKLPAGRFSLALGATVVTMVLTALTTQIFTMIQGVLTAKIVPDVVKEMKSQVFEAMSKLSVSFYSKKQTGSLMSRILDDAERVTDFYINSLPYFFIHTFSIIFISIVMFSMDWLLALCSLILLPILTIISFRMMPRLWGYYGRRSRSQRSLNAQVNDNITGARVVKAFGQEDTELKRFHTYNQRVKNSELDLVAFDNRFKALYTIVENVSTYVVMGLGSYLVLTSDKMQLGLLVTFINYVGLLKQPLNFMSQIFRNWTESMNSAQRVFEIIDAVPEIVESDNPVSLANMRGDIEFRNVTFGYDQNKTVLKNVSFSVEAGKMLGIVGRSGAGKSTLVNLISRLYDTLEGEVLIDGVNVKDIAFEDLHKNIAMVSQETYIFMGTVAQNIAYAKPHASRDEIIQAARLASAHDFICKMPDGYDSNIGAAGRQLSGGERQRISIARAILANPKILILDEATASVDTETEQAIQKSLSYLIQGRTTLSIAHRLSTLKDADSLVVIDDGKLTESGTHQELIDQKGTYYTLLELQTKALALRGIE